MSPTDPERELLEEGGFDRDGDVGGVFVPESSCGTEKTLRQEALGQRTDKPRNFSSTW